jgi:chondroitin AC lyase
MAESINEENLKGGGFLNCGDHYVLRDGQEYVDMPPVWQWQYLPGLTTTKVEKKAETERKSFVGSVDNGQSGLTAMDYARYSRTSGVNLRKSWFFHDDMVICLMGGRDIIEKSGDMTSSLEQCKLQNDVLVKTQEKGPTKIEHGDHHFDQLDWVLHNKIGYIPLYEVPVDIFMGDREGSWYDINQGQSKATVRQSVFQILLDHGDQPKPQGWVIVLGATSDKMDAIAKNPPWEVLRNDRECQAIEFDDGLCMASFYNPGSAGKTLNVSVDNPCLTMWTKDHLWMSDPTKEGLEVNVNWNGLTQVIRLPKDEKTVKESVAGDI